MKLTDMLRAKGKSLDESESHSERWREEVQSIGIERIQTNPYQPRSEFDSEGLDELAQSISEHGILHPVIVREFEDNYQLIVGERRLRACKLLGWTSVPAIIKQVTDKASAELALIENLQRRDLHFFEEAEGYYRLLEEFELKQEELAKKLGKSQSSIANRLRLLKLSTVERAAISEHSLSARHARALLKVDSQEERLALIKEIADKSLNVAQTETLVEKINEKKLPKEPQRSNRKIVFKDIRLFTNSLKELTDCLTESGLTVDYLEEEEEEYYKVSVVIRKPKKGGQ